MFIQGAQCVLTSSLAPACVWATPTQQRKHCPSCTYTALESVRHPECGRQRFVCARGTTGAGWCDRREDDHRGREQVCCEQAHETGENNNEHIQQHTNCISWRWLRLDACMATAIPPSICIAMIFLKNWFTSHLPRDENTACPHPVAAARRRLHQRQLSTTCGRMPTIALTLSSSVFPQACSPQGSRSSCQDHSHRVQAFAQGSFCHCR